MHTEPERHVGPESSSWHERYERSLARERDADHPATWPREVWSGLAVTALARVAAVGMLVWAAASSDDPALWLITCVYALYVLLIVIGRTRAWMRRNDA